MEQIVSKISMDFMKPAEPPLVHAVQGEENTRVVQLSVFCDGQPWMIPHNTHIAVRYGRVVLTGGCYDTLPDGSGAYSYEGNVITITLAPQMMASPGTVYTQVELLGVEQRLITFSFCVMVAANPASGITEAEKYMNWEQWLKHKLDVYIEGLQESTQLAGTAVGPINMNGQPLTGLRVPVEAGDAATKGYADAAAQKARSRNLMDNSDFTNPVNQRNYLNGTSIDGYFIDRWFANTGIFEVSANGIKITAGHMNQRLQTSRFEEGETYTLACKVDGEILCYSGVKGSTIGVWEEGLVAAYMPEYNLYIVYLTKTGSTYEWVAMYKGAYTAETLPEYQAKGYSAELCECLRYYRKSWTDHIAFDSAVCFRAAASYGNMPLLNWEVPMRANPTVTIRTWAEDPEYRTGYVRDWEAGTNIPVGIGLVTTQGFALTISAEDPLAQNRLYCYHYEASADL